LGDVIIASVEYLISCEKAGIVEVNEIQKLEGKLTGFGASNKCGIWARCCWFYDSVHTCIVICLHVISSSFDCSEVACDKTIALILILYTIHLSERYML